MSGRISTLARISIGLVFVTLSLVFTGDMFFGVAQNPVGPILEARKKLCESLAIQFSTLIAKGDFDTIEQTLLAVVRRSPELLSGALRAVDGNVVAEAGVHRRFWVAPPGGTSTATNAQVPIFQGADQWGAVEIRFAPLEDNAFQQFTSSPLVRLALFVAVVGFFAYLIFMRRTLKHLDPSSVIPERVKTALDALAEGVVLVDHEGLIVLANSAFADKVDNTASALLGRNLSWLNWTMPITGDRVTEPPWTGALRDGQGRVGIALCLDLPQSGLHTFMVNSSPIVDDQGNSRGALTTFDDVTDVERKNQQLKEMLELLETSRDEVNRQNEQLQVLATRDAMTNCLNRRAFFEKLEAEFAHAQKSGEPLSCIMSDIDHFKSINDTYGHGVGDQVIQKVASTLRSGVRSIDVVGRYGGEEFCILLPGLAAEKAMEVAERLRQTIETDASSSLRFTSGRKITSSFGVSSTEFGAADPSGLVDEADRGLYESKNGGRNRVTRYDAEMAEQAAVG